ncbi:hypothetical protein ES703_23288 [subsurface metagenome]
MDHRGLWGLTKAWDADCYVYSDRASYKVPEDICLELYRGSDLAGRRFRLVPLGIDKWGIALLAGGSLFTIEEVRKLVAPRLFSMGKWSPRLARGL